MKRDSTIDQGAASPAALLQRQQKRPRSRRADQVPVWGYST